MLPEMSNFLNQYLQVLTRRSSHFTPKTQANLPKIVCGSSKPKSKAMIFAQTQA